MFDNRWPQELNMTSLSQDHWYCFKWNEKQWKQKCVCACSLHDQWSLLTCFGPTRLECIEPQVAKTPQIKVIGINTA